MDAFCSKGQVNLGAELGVCAGPVGRVASGAVEASSDLAIAPCYSYSHSKGLFVGISLEGSMILARSDINRAFYGRDVQVSELLGGMETPPVAAAPLYEAIELAMSRYRQPRVMIPSYLLTQRLIYYCVGSALRMV